MLQPTSRQVAERQSEKESKHGQCKVKLSFRVQFLMPKDHAHMYQDLCLKIKPNRSYIEKT